MSRLDLSFTDAATIRLATVTLTNAQILALPTTPITLIAAPGAGKRIVPIVVDLFGNFTAGAYTNVDANDSYLSVALGGIDYMAYLANWPPSLLTDLTSFLTNAAKVHATLPPWAPTDPEYGSVAYGEAAGATLINAALTIYASNAAAGNFTGGNAANTCKARVLFTVESD